MDKKISPSLVYIRVLVFLTQKIVLNLSEIKVGSGIWKKHILDLGVKKASDPGSGSATLLLKNTTICVSGSEVPEAAEPHNPAAGTHPGIQAGWLTHL